MKKTFFALLVLALFSPQTPSAQTAAEMERVLALPAVSCGDAAWFVLGAAGAAPTENSADGAYRFAADSGWLPKKAAAETAEAGPKIPADETPVIPLPARVQEERERIVEIIHAELEEKRVTDTEVRATNRGITISLNNIQFLPDSTELTEVEKQKLQNIAVILNGFPDRNILVGGHAAMAGSAEGRMRVSVDRAQAVADYLVGLGCRTRDGITVRGYGAEQPLGDPATEAGQTLNRRVEITLLDEGSGE